MSRIKDLQKQVFKVLADTDEPMKAMAHLHGVSLAAVMIAKNVAKILSWQPWRDFCMICGLTSPAPMMTMPICDAIWHHDDKANVDSTFTEVLKDADVIDHCLTDPTKEIKEKERSRYGRLCREFDLMED